MLRFSRSFALLWQGQLVSQLGNQAFLIATAYFTLEVTGSATLVAAVMMASTVPIVLIGPLGGTLADRRSRRAILVATDLARAIAVGGLGLYFLWQPSPAPHHVSLLIAVATGVGVMHALFAPAVHAFIPDLVPGERLAAANAVMQVSSQTSLLVGQAAGGILYLSWGAAGLLIFDGCSFAYAGLATWLIPPDRRRLQPPLTVWRALRRIGLETREGVAYVWRRRGLGALLLLFAGVNGLFMPVFVLLPFYVRTVLAGGPEWYGFLLAASAAGALAGSAVAPAVISRVPAGFGFIRACVSGIAGCVMLLAAASSSLVALAAFVGIGALSSLINVAVLTTFQSAVPSAIRGRVMALVVTLSTAVVPLGMGLGGIAGDLWSGSLRLVFAGCGAAIAMLTAVTLRVKAFDDGLPDRG